MIEWKEREHEFDDIATLKIPQVRENLQNFGLLKYFKHRVVLFHNFRLSKHEKPPGFPSMDSLKSCIEGTIWD
jgi:hypothetical protein